MKMGMTRVQAIMDHDDAKVMLNLSMQAAKDLSLTLQACGIRAIRLATVETMGGHQMKASDIKYFDGVPPEIAKWSVPAIDGIAALMGAFGISSVSFEPERDDLRDLARNWRYIVNDGSQLDKVREAETEEASRPASEPVGPRPPERGERLLPGMPFGPDVPLPDDEPARQTPKESEEDGKDGYGVTEIVV